jgi:hypothetical protein
MTFNGLAFLARRTLAVFKTGGTDIIFAVIAETIASASPLVHSKQNTKLYLQPAVVHTVHNETVLENVVCGIVESTMCATKF